MECLFIIMKFAAAANIHEKLFNKSFARSSQMVRINYAGRQIK